MQLRLVSVVAVIAAVLSTQPASAGLKTWTSRPLSGGAAYAIVPHPTRPRLVFAGTSHGLFRSTDAGQSWTRAARGLAHHEWVNDVDFARGSPDTGYLVARSGLYRTVDAGASWSRVNTTYDGGDLEIHPHDDRILFGNGSYQLTRSTDGGATWTPLLQPDGDPLDASIVRVAASNPDRAYAVGLYGYRSSDGGQTWAHMALPGYGSASALAVDPRNSARLFVATGGGIYKSNDGGQSWASVLDTRYHIIETVHLWAADPDVIYVAGYLHGVYRSSNGGTTWRLLRKGLPAEPVRTVATTPGGAAYAGTPHHGVFLWSAQASAWTSRTKGVTAPHIAALAVAPSEPLTLYAGGFYAGVAHSYDGGTTWRWQGLGGQYVSDLAVHPRQPNTVFAAGHQLYRSRDGGRTWRRLLAEQYTSFRAIAFAPSRPATVYAASWDHIFRSRDGGDTWVSVRDGGAASLAVHPTKPDVVFAGSNGGAVRFSRDGGLTWRAGAGIYDGYEIRDIELQPGAPHRLFATTDGDGIIRSTDGGVTWRPIGSGDPRVTYSLEIDRQRPHVLYAGNAEESGGVYRSTDGGRSWSRMSAGLDACLIGVLALTRSGNVLHAGTSAFGAETAQGVWSYRFR